MKNYTVKARKLQKEFREQLGVVDTMNRKWTREGDKGNSWTWIFFSMIPLNVAELGSHEMPLG